MAQERGVATDGVEGPPGWGEGHASLGGGAGVRAVTGHRQPSPVEQLHE